MGQREPLREQLRGFVRRRAVKRHHRRGNPRRAQQLRPPSVADGHHLDQVRTPADGLFEAMNGHVVLFLSE